MKTKPFDLQAALAGKPWGARDGRKGAFLAHDPSGTEACRVVCRFDDRPYLTTRHEDGRAHFGKTHPGDLVMLVEKRTVYVNLYDHGASWFDNKYLAETAAAISNAFAIAIPVEMEE